MAKQVEIIGRLSSSLGRRDEVPNQELAKDIAQNNDREAVKILVDNLSNKDKNIQGDCTKALYETGMLKPDLIAGYVGDFLKLLKSKNNRLQWGGMTALHALAPANMEGIYEALPEIIEAADNGSVITKDHAVGILTILCMEEKYREDALELLMEQMEKSPANQFPTYAEKALPFINDRHKARYLQILRLRLEEIDQESKRKRIEKAIRKVEAAT